MQYTKSQEHDHLEFNFTFLDTLLTLRNSPNYVSFCIFINNSLEHQEMTITLQAFLQSISIFSVD